MDNTVTRIERRSDGSYIVTVNGKNHECENTQAMLSFLEEVGDGRIKDLSDGLGLCRVIMEDDFKKAIKNMPKGIIVDAVPVSELEELRDYLYSEDLIFMRGLAKLNKLIAKHGGTETGKTPDKNTKP